MRRLTRMRRQMAAACMMVGVVALAVAPSALAGDDLLTPTGVITYNGNTGPRHSLTDVHGTSWDTGGHLACVTAFNLDGSQAGLANCAAVNYLASHPYNSTLRYGFIYASPQANISGTGYQDW